MRALVRGATGVIGGAVAARESPRGLRVNVVSPRRVRESQVASGVADPDGLPAAEVARAYLASVEGAFSGRTLRPGAPA